MSDESLDPFKQEGRVKTDMHCHACGNNFVAEIDYSLNGNHVVECPHCRHEHCRVIKDGVVTGDRFDGRNGGTFKVQERRIWKASNDVLQVQTSSAAMFIRNSWLNRER